MQLSQNVDVDATMSIQGVTETVEVTATASLIEKDSSAIKSSVVDRADPAAAGRPAVPRPRQADPRRAVHAGRHARPERRRAAARTTPTSFDGVNVTTAAVRHAVGRALVARHRAGDDAQGRRARGGLRARGRVLDRLGQQVGHEQVRRPGQLPVPGQRDGRRGRSAADVALRPGPHVDHAQRRRPGHSQQAVSSTARTTAPRPTRTNASNLYGEVPGYESTRNEGFGKLTASPTNSTLFNFSYRYSHRLDKGDTFGQTTAPTAGSGSRGRGRRS